MQAFRLPVPPAGQGAQGGHPRGPSSGTAPADELSQGGACWDPGVSMEEIGQLQQLASSSNAERRRLRQQLQAQQVEMDRMRAASLATEAENLLLRGYVALWRSFWGDYAEPLFAARAAIHRAHAQQHTMAIRASVAHWQREQRRLGEEKHEVEDKRLRLVKLLRTARGKLSVEKENTAQAIIRCQQLEQEAQALRDQVTILQEDIDVLAREGAAAERNDRDMQRTVRALQETVVELERQRMRTEPVHPPHEVAARRRVAARWPPSPPRGSGGGSPDGRAAPAARRSGSFFDQEWYERELRARDTEILGLRETLRQLSRHLATYPPQALRHDVHQPPLRLPSPTDLADSPSASLPSHSRPTSVTRGHLTPRQQRCRPSAPTSPSVLDSLKRRYGSEHAEPLIDVTNTDGSRLNTEAFSQHQLEAALLQELYGAPEQTLGRGPTRPLGHDAAGGDGPSATERQCIDSLFR